MFPSGVKATLLGNTKGVGAIFPGGTKEVGVHLSRGILRVMSLQIIASETGSWTFSTGEPGALEGDRSRCLKVSGRGPGDLFLQSQTLPSVQSLSCFCQSCAMEKNRQPTEPLREGAMSSFSTGLEGLINGGDLGMGTSLLHTPRQGCF